MLRRLPQSHQARKIEQYTIVKEIFAQYYGEIVVGENVKWRRILLKVSGEALLGDSNYGIDNSVIDRLVSELQEIQKLGIEVGIVIGGGNIFRGISVAAKGGNRITGDHMGMLATVMNGLALVEALTKVGVKARVLSAIEIPAICETFTQRAAQHYMSIGEILVFVGGTGNPLFTTDSAAALRAAEMGCDAILKATKVDGIYSADPNVDSKATRFDKISHGEVLKRDLKIMDAAAIALARENDIPLIVFSIHTPGALIEVVKGTGRSTIVTD